MKLGFFASTWARTSLGFVESGRATNLAVRRTCRLRLERKPRFALPAPYMCGAHGTVRAAAARGRQSSTTPMPPESKWKRDVHNNPHTLSLRHQPSTRPSRTVSYRLDRAKPFCPNKGHRARDGGGHVRVPAELHEGRPVQPPGARLVRGGNGLLCRLFFLGSARDGEKQASPKDTYVHAVYRVETSVLLHCGVALAKNNTPAIENKSGQGRLCSEASSSPMKRDGCSRPRAQSKNTPARCCFLLARFVVLFRSAKKTKNNYRRR